MARIDSRVDKRVDLRVDYRGLRCPLPVLKANKHIRTLKLGQDLEILVDDPKAAADFRSYCELSGHRLVSLRSSDSGDIIVIKKSSK